MVVKMARRGLRKLVITIAGYFILALGLAMVVLPGPAFILIPLGLGILAVEYEWARKIRDKGLAWLRERKKGRTAHEERKSEE